MRLVPRPSEAIQSWMPFLLFTLHCLLRSCISQYSVTFLVERREDSSRTREGLDVLKASQLPPSLSSGRKVTAYHPEDL